MRSPNFRFVFLVGAIAGAAVVSAFVIRQGTSIVPDAYRQEVQRLLATEPSLGKDRYASIRQLDRQGRQELQAKGSFPKLVRGNPKRKVVALTFDDGPYAEYTPKLLAVLKKAGVKATMFNIGYKVEKDPSLLKAEIAAGHEIANHTYSHIRLPTLNAEMVDKELAYGAEALQKAGGLSHVVDICRPPGGQYNEHVISSATTRKYTLALWTDDPGDYTNPGVAVIKSRLLRDLSPGAIVLLHDGVQQTLDALPGFIAEAKLKGYTFVTCSKLMADPMCVKSGGPNTYTGK